MNVQHQLHHYIFHITYSFQITYLIIILHITYLLCITTFLQLHIRKFYAKRPLKNNSVYLIIIKETKQNSLSKREIFKKKTKFKYYNL